MLINFVEGGICAPKGFQAGGIHCGFRRNKLKKDLGIILSDVECNVAAVFTQNKIKGAPIEVTKKHIANGKARAIICNSGNANTCAPNGVTIAQETCILLAKELHIKPQDIMVSSTGVIGQPLTMEPFERGIPKLVKKLSYTGSDSAAHAIMTTDTLKKERAVSFVLGNKECHIGGIAKGSGMIHPNMATMLAFITTDVSITQPMLQKALSADVLDTFNQISVDGDTSTNDTVAVLANGMAGNQTIEAEGEAFDIFCKALRLITQDLARLIAKDGEGATKLLECVVSGAHNREVARKIAKSIITSSLLKSAMFGADANWGRILCAIGYTEGDFSMENIDVVLSSAKGNIEVCRGSAYYPFSEELSKKILKENEIKILVSMNQGSAQAAAWGCDLTYDYVRINGDYRT